MVFLFKDILAIKVALLQDIHFPAFGSCMGYLLVVQGWVLVQSCITGTVRLLCIDTLIIYTKRKAPTRCARGAGVFHVHGQLFLSPCAVFCTSPLFAPPLW